MLYAMEVQKRGKKEVSTGRTRDVFLSIVLSVSYQKSEKLSDDMKKKIQGARR